MSGDITFDRNKRSFTEKGQPQSEFANIGSVTPKAWYLEEIKRILQEMTKTKDEATKRDLEESLQQIKQEMIDNYPR